MNYEKLQNNMIDQIKEAQMKLGYVKETVRLYYPLSSLCNLLEMEVPTAPEEISGEKALPVAQMDFTDNLKHHLQQYFGDDDVLGNVSFVFRAENVEVGIPPKGVEYVHHFVEEPAFLKALIQLFENRHHCTIEDVKELFRSFSADYVCEGLTGEMATARGFDYVLYFRDSTIDAYYYCLKEEMGHLHYHRFTKADYVQSFAG
ncbi:MAG: DUF3877 family protein [Lachnospiraceae bacterium]|nr:DUF3877 family protein [Lachnospiraceae bacterium]